MTLILKSKSTVQNPDREFGYLSDFGVTTRSLKHYSDLMKLSGSALSASQFAALSKFEEDCKNAQVWDNIVEFMPMLGANVDSQMCKLKYKNSPQATPSKFTSNHIDESIGLKWDTHESINAACADLDYNTDDILEQDGYGIFVYYKLKSLPLIYAGASFFSGSTVSDRITGGLKMSSTVFGSPHAPSDYLADTDPHLHATASKWGDSRILAGREMYKDGVRVAKIEVNVELPDATSITNKGIRLGANLQSDGTTHYGFFGGMRLFLIHDGILSETGMMHLSSIVEDLIDSLGKRFI